eukprot:13415497-Ditylum_brightwellii.AAC.1
MSITQEQCNTLSAEETDSNNSNVISSKHCTKDALEGSERFNTSKFNLKRMIIIATNANQVESLCYNIYRSPPKNGQYYHLCKPRAELSAAVLMGRKIYVIKGHNGISSISSME